MNKEEITDNPEKENLETENMDKNQEEVKDKNEELADKTAESSEKTAEEKYAELYDNYLRLFSEFDNFRKRSAKERIDLIKSAGADTINAILPVLDDFERAVKNMANSDKEALEQGLNLIFNKLKNSLTEKGLEEMNPIGEEFNPDLHEAITKLPAPSDKEKNTILDVTEKGYKLNDVVIRYPKVVVYT